MEVSAICDIDTNKLSEFQEIYEIKHAYTSYSDLLNNKQIDSISICVPSWLHHKLAIQAIQSHKHLLLEKPMAMNTIDAKDIIQTANTNEVKLAVVFQNRYKNAVQTVQKLSPILWNLLYVSAQVFRYRPQSYYNDGVHGKRQMDGGVLMNQAIHFIDAILYLANKKITKTMPLARTLAHKMEMEDAITVNFSFDDGSIGNIQANTITYPENYEWSIVLFFENATIKIWWNCLDTIEYIGADQGIKDTIVQTHQDYVDKQSITNIDPSIYCHYKVLENFMAAIVDNQSPLVTGESALWSLQFIEDCYNSLYI